MIQFLPAHTRIQRGFQIILILALATAPLLLLSQTANAALTLDQARACYNQLNGKSSIDNPMTDAACSSVCPATSASDGYIWHCIDPNAAAITPDSTSDTVLATKRLYGAAVGGAVCNQTVAQEKAGCVDSATRVVVDCINSWVSTLSGAELQNFIISNINVDSVATCAAQELNAPKSTIVAALNSAKTSVDTAVTNAVNSTDQKSCESAGNTWNPSTNTCTAAVKCTGGPLGWVLCPLIDVFRDVINTTAGFLNSMLFIAPIGSNTNLQGIWSTFVGVANLLLVAAFLVVIFSQATSIGLSAYGIKKMLPRIIAAAILINLSYFICTLALDITNIIGGTIGTLVQSFMPTATLSDSSTLGAKDSWAAWIGLSLTAAVAAAIAAAVGAIAFIVPLLLAAAFAILSIFLIIALRQVLVILLIIISPLAFAAMILPNTESLFTKWRKLFTNMLIMYPVAMFIMYGSQLVGALIIASKTVTSSGGTAANPATSWITDIIAAIIMTVGAFAALYMYLKSSNKIMSMAAGGLGKFGAMAQKRSQGWAKSKYDRSTFGVGRSTQRAFKDEAAKERAYGRMADGKSLSGRLGMLGVRGQTRTRMNAYAQAQGDKLYKSDVENEQVRLGKTVENNAAASVEAFKDKVKSGSMTKAQANAHVNHLLGLKGGKTSLRRLFEDQQFMQDLGKAGGTEGMVIGAIGSDKFMAAQPDIANALNYHREQFVKDAQAGKAGEYLGANYAAGATTSSGRTVIDKSKGAFQDWGWYAQRPGMLHAMSHDHTGHVYDKISYNVATATQKDPAFSNADPGIQDMINAIVAAGPPPKGSTATNNLGTFKPGVTGNPTWLNWSK